MPILFYDHLINKSEIESLVTALEEAENLRQKTLQLVDDILYQGIILMLLDKLHRSHHQTFLEMVHDRPYDPEIIIFLKERIHKDIDKDIGLEGMKLLRSTHKTLIEVKS